MKRVKIERGHYKLMYEFHPGCFRAVATAVKSGTRRDNYPWDWYFDYGVRLADARPRDRGTATNLREIYDVVESRIKQYGVLIGEVETVETDGDSA